MKTNFNHDKKRVLKPTVIKNSNDDDKKRVLKPIKKKNYSYDAETILNPTEKHDSDIDKISIGEFLW